MANASAPQALANFNDRFYFAKQQFVSAVLGFLLLLIFSKIHFTFWQRIATPLFIFSVMLLVAIFIPSLGLNLLGAKRWISFGLFSFQPSELVKFSLILYFAKLYKNEKKMLAYFLPLGLVAFLIMLQPDLGTTLVVTGVGLVQIFAAGVNIFYFLIALVLSSFASLGLILTSAYRKARLLTFLHQSRDPLGESYHIRQILFSLGLGGLLGTGLGASRQKFLYLPEAATDSIFAVIAEEMGFIGASIILILFLLLIIRGIKISLGVKDGFGRMLSLGITSWIAIQMALNIGSMVALVPLTGVPLPFFSYGGTALATILSSVGILLNISKYAYKQK